MAFFPSIIFSSILNVHLDNDDDDDDDDEDDEDDDDDDDARYFIGYETI